jgi:hypothetical protein
MWLRTSVAPLTKIKKKISLEFGEIKTSIITEREEKKERVREEKKERVREERRGSLS